MCDLPGGLLVRPGHTALCRASLAIAENRTRTAAKRDRQWPALHEETRGAQRFSQFLLDAHRIGAGDSLQMQRGSREDLEPAPQHAAGRANPRLVLLEALHRRIVTHAHVQPERIARLSL